MERTDYIIKQNNSKQSCNALYNLLYMNNSYANKIVGLGFLFNEYLYYKFISEHQDAKEIIIIDNYIEHFEWIKNQFKGVKVRLVEYENIFDNMPHFDIMIMNPPYGNKGNNTIHLDIIKNCLAFSKNVIAIFPFSLITKFTNDKLNQYKQEFNGKLSSVVEVKSSVFERTAMMNVGIYVFNQTSKNIKITYLNGDTITVDSLSDIDSFSSYENDMIKYLKNNGTQYIIKNIGGTNKRKKELVNIPKEKQQEYLDNKLINTLKSLKQELNKNRYALIVNRANGAMNGTAFSNNCGQFSNNYNELKEYFLKLQTSIGYNAILLNSKKAAKHCKIAMQNPVLRFTFYKLQEDQNMTAKVYSLVPAIDWEDSRVITDEGLLEVCGCPKDKCKEYAEYCKNYMEKVDNGTINN